MTLWGVCIAGVSDNPVTTASFGLVKCGVGAGKQQFTTFIRLQGGNTEAGGN
jgi:hypothetical protein